MIRSFGDKATEALFNGRRTSFPPEVRRIGRRKLDMINAAAKLQDLRSPPGNRLEPLKGKLDGFHSIRVNDQWRVVLRWENSDALEVKIVDYH
ncbi:MAG: plasmid maintenance system killer family protein [Phycisphaerales bacterium]|nr:type II toxin-antitoxin system RelE/ParE family toxin [Phycisphaerae bacterium]NNM27698.1 plasmid maintenance system killer family protein [Phycisphaerales bacterium]